MKLRKGKGWRGEPLRHGLARRGIGTAIFSKQVKPNYESKVVDAFKTGMGSTVSVHEVKYEFERSQVKPQDVDRKGKVYVGTLTTDKGKKVYIGESKDKKALVKAIKGA